MKRYKENYAIVESEDIGSLFYMSILISFTRKKYNYCFCFRYEQIIEGAGEAGVTETFTQLNRLLDGHPNTQV